MKIKNYKELNLVIVILAIILGILVIKYIVQVGICLLIATVCLTILKHYKNAYVKYENK